MQPIDVPLPGEGQHDPGIKDLDAIGFALLRTICHVIWIDEHLRDFLQSRGAEPERAEQELRHLAGSVAQLKPHVERLRQLLVAGYTIDPAKELPEGLDERVWGAE